MGKREQRHPFYPADFFVLRTPLLPFAALPGLASDPWPGLRSLLEDPVVREAVFVATPSLYAAGVDRDRGEVLLKVQMGLMRYVTRMATRATPFGLLAGVSVGTIGPSTHLALSGRPGMRRHTRIDHGYLASLTERLREEPSLAPRLVCRPNETLYAFAGQLRYIESELRDEERTYRVSALVPDEPLLRTLERAHAGATAEELARALIADDPEIALDDARAYIHALVEQQVLLHDLSAPITGTDALAATIRTLEAKGERLADVLQQVQADLRRLDSEPLGVPADRYRDLAGSLPEADLALANGALVQVDMTVAAPELTLGKEVVDTIADGAAVLYRLFGRTQDEELIELRERFRDRFDRREMPLLFATDPDAGIGFGGDAPAAEAPLIDGLDLARPAARPPYANGDVEQLLLRLVLDAASRGAREVTLTDDDVARLRHARRPPLPSTFAVYGSIAATGAAAIDSGDFTVRVDGIAGASGARLFGRFCHTSPELQSRVQDYITNEHEDGCVYAEIVHIPEGRLGNVVCRPLLFDYEIPLLGRSGAPAERHLALDDLHVSVIGDEIVLRSRRLNRRVIPRLTNAHNYLAAANVPLYRFLCSLAAQGEAANVTWSWRLVDSAPFLPRVRHGRCVLALARWLARPPELATQADVEAYRATHHLPRFVEHKRLVIDLDNRLSVDELLKEAARQELVELREVFPDADALPVTSDAGRHVHEYVVPFINDERRARVPPRIQLPVQATRSFAPGSEWTYAKLYGAPGNADRLLLETLRPMLEAVAPDCLWFFTRYADPHQHLRFRIRAGAGVMQTVATALQRLVHDQIERLQFDTYEREVERYGGPFGVALAEEIFHCDSEAALDLLAGRPAPDARWRIALTALHTLLHDLVDDPEERRQIVRDCREAFGGEFGVERSARRSLARRYRELEPSLETDDDGVRAILAARSSALAAPAARLAGLVRDGQLTVPRGRFVISCLHMSVNRLFQLQQRMHELVLYDFLDRLYAADMARQ